MALRLSVEETDHITTPGRLATLRIGPFAFYASSAKTGLVAFEIIIGDWNWGWMIGLGHG